ncbi:hypothetical protein EX30DRAFT_388241 [Ascodesmis nigricans]|uniref:Uncharacterized protein n=1 Tax=Ascodesmis nigricans TaxID=341454 RepID=A0A4S2MP60_9PEZI|nr:hypothetical protein EX30DRAFT_388241 [Ascodesmis nigricans]
MATECDPQTSHVHVNPSVLSSPKGSSSRIHKSPPILHRSSSYYDSPTHIKYDSHKRSHSWCSYFPKGANSYNPVEPPVEEELVTISCTEYQYLKERVCNLEEEVQRLQNKVQNPSYSPRFRESSFPPPSLRQSTLFDGLNKSEFNALFGPISYAGTPSEEKSSQNSYQGVLTSPFQSPPLQYKNLYLPQHLNRTQLEQTYLEQEPQQLVEGQYQMTPLYSQHPSSGYSPAGSVKKSKGKKRRSIAPLQVSPPMPYSSSPRTPNFHQNPPGAYNSYPQHQPVGMTPRTPYTPQAFNHSPPFQHYHGQNGYHQQTPATPYRSQPGPSYLDQGFSYTQPSPFQPEPLPPISGVQACPLPRPQEPFGWQMDNVPHHNQSRFQQPFVSEPHSNPVVSSRPPYQPHATPGPSESSTLGTQTQEHAAQVRPFTPVMQGNSSPQWSQNSDIDLQQTEPSKYKPAFDLIGTWPLDECEIGYAFTKGQGELSVITWLPSDKKEESTSSTVTENEEVTPTSATVAESEGIITEEIASPTISGNGEVPTQEITAPPVVEQEEAPEGPAAPTPPTKDVKDLDEQASDVTTADITSEVVEQGNVEIPNPEEVLETQKTDESLPEERLSFEITEGTPTITVEAIRDLLKDKAVLSVEVDGRALSQVNESPNIEENEWLLVTGKKSRATSPTPYDSLRSQKGSSKAAAAEANGAGEEANPLLAPPNHKSKKKSKAPTKYRYGPHRKLYITGIPPTMTYDKFLKSIKGGLIDDVFISGLSPDFQRDRPKEETENQGWFGYITFYKPDGAQNYINYLENTDTIKGSRLGKCGQGMICGYTTFDGARLPVYMRDHDQRTLAPEVDEAVTKNNATRVLLFKFKCNIITTPPLKHTDKAAAMYSKIYDDNKWNWDTWTKAFHSKNGSDAVEKLKRAIQVWNMKPTVYYQSIEILPTEKSKKPTATVEIFRARVNFLRISTALKVQDILRGHRDFSKHCEIGFDKDPCTDQLVPIADKLSEVTSGTSSPGPSSRPSTPSNVATSNSNGPQSPSKSKPKRKGKKKPQPLNFNDENFPVLGGLSSSKGPGSGPTPVPLGAIKAKGVWAVMAKRSSSAPSTPTK